MLSVAGLGPVAERYITSPTRNGSPPSFHTSCYFLGADVLLPDMHRRVCLLLAIVFAVAGLRASPVDYLSTAFRAGLGMASRLAAADFGPDVADR